MNYADIAIITVVLVLIGMISIFAFGDQLVKHKH